MTEQFDHTKKYAVIDGHLIEMSFSKTRNEKLFAKISGILLNTDTHICKLRTPDVKCETKAKEA